MADAAQIAQYASQQLWFGNKLLDRTIKDRVKTAVAIALAESGGDVTAVSPPNKDGTIDVGLWQINSIHRGDHPEWTTTWLQNPTNNAKAMAVLSGKGVNWLPWTQFKNGEYKKHLEVAEAAVEGNTLTQGVGELFEDVPIVGDAIDAAEATVDVLKAIADPIIKGAQWLGNPRNWVRIIEVGGGVALGIVAVGVIIKPAIKEAKDTVL